ncbi:MAG TPA: hypothetical protein VN909_03330, partial [Candidatus Dormibacteraeota bacterium]|nr:hypothetical protein [Candidatus Dormibacteraeota bacterium]
RLTDRSARPRVEFALSEALRLVSLPGEEQGRVYYFRRVRVTGVPADGNRAIWLMRLQQALTESAQGATHGGDRRSRGSNVVFFDSREEALETLLGRALRREATTEWFWPLVSGCRAGVNRGELVVGIVQRLRELPASWSRVAHVVFAEADESIPIELLSVLPVATAAAWLREFGEGSVDDGAVAGVVLPEVAARSLARAVRRFGREDPRTLWLASLAVLRVSLASFAAAVIARARATLRRIEAMQTLDANSIWVVLPAGSERPPIAFDDDTRPPRIDGLTDLQARQAPGARTLDGTVDGGAVDVRTVDGGAVDKRTHDGGSFSKLTGDQVSGKRSESHAAVRSTEIDSKSTSHIAAEEGHSEVEQRVVQAERPYLGVPSNAAGLYFLINALTHLGFADAAAVDPRIVEARLAPRILARLSEHVGVEATDPIMAWINAEIVASNEAFAKVVPDAAAWPSFLGRCPRRNLEARDIVRAWALAVRRWCWRVGRLTIRDVVDRNGRVLSTRTDIDVSLPLEGADVRIRRIGLDLDPGWIPWFGCVVHFHYGNERD